MFNSPIHPLKTGSAFTNLNVSLYWNPDTPLINCWCCPLGTTKLEVWLIGSGGGGGGGGVRGPGNTWGGGGAGGGGGGVSSCVFYGSDIPASATVCLGAGGAGGCGAVGLTCATNGANGGMTSFGSIVHAGGGGGGQRGRSCVSAQVAESTGGAGGTGNYSPRGGSGGNGYFFPTVPNPGNEAFPGVFQVGGGAGGGAGTFGGVTECQAGACAAFGGNPVPVGAFCGSLPNGIVMIGGGDGGSQAPQFGTVYLNGRDAFTFYCGGGGGGGGGGGAFTGVFGVPAGNGGNGAPGVALVISYF